MNAESSASTELSGASHRLSISPWPLLDGCAEAIAVIDASGIIAYANSAVAEWLGAGQEGLSGACIWDLCPNTASEHLGELVERVLHTAAPAHFEYTDHDRWFEVRVEPYAGLAPRQVVVYVRDATHQVEVEERLKLTNLRLIEAQENERKRIAQDLHDDIGQRMTAILLSLKTTHKSVVSRDGCSGAEIGEAIASLEKMMAQARSIIQQICPPHLTMLSLPRALEALANSFALASGLQIDFSSAGNLPAVPDAQAMVIYRFVQEGLNNASKHALATSAWINLDCVDGEIAISLEDDGQGFDPEHQQSLCLGLQGIRDRFQMLNGSFAVESSPGRGARLCGSLPLNDSRRTRCCDDTHRDC